jgi:hypothetical protein
MCIYMYVYLYICLYMYIGYVNVKNALLALAMFGRIEQWCIYMYIYICIFI